MSGKRIVMLALEEGFLNDRVLVRTGDREIADLDDVSTRVQIGLARSLDIELAEGEDALTVALPLKSLEATVPIGEAGPRYVGVSVADSGSALSVRTGEAPVGYV